MKIAYFDCFSGASGDMILGALLDAGLSIDALRREIAALGLDHYALDVEKVVKNGVAGSRAIVRVEEDHHRHRHRRLADIEAIIGGSRLSHLVKGDAIRIFRRLAEAEAAVHATAVDQIHFHEVGAMDAIIDVTGAVAGLAALGIDRICCSPLHVGAGTVHCAHGVLPVPAPATLALVKDRPIYSTGVQGELLTPTGAAILTTLAEDFGPMPRMTVEATGYGAGAADRSIPNLLRVVIGRDDDEAAGYETESMAVIETTIDDMNPQIYEYLMETALAEGAADIFLTPIQMKKNRPGTLVTLLVPLEKRARISDLLLRETTSIGLRWRVDQRLVCQREIVDIDTPYGPVRAKVSRRGAAVINATPEYEDCKRLAAETGTPLKTVMAAARAAMDRPA